MARKRMLHPGFFTSEDVAAVPIPARLTFAGLWVYVDDAGRGKDVAALVKAAVWPLDDEVGRADVESHLVALADRGLVCRYADAGAPLLHVVTWQEHQRISHPTPSKLAPCAAHEEGPKDSEKRRSRSGASPESSGETPRSVVQGSRGQSSSSTEPAAAAASSQPVDNLRQALEAAGLVARWRLCDADLEDVERLVELHGVAPLVASARRQHRPDAPAAYASAWLGGWRELSPPRPRIVRDPCPTHPYLPPAASCSACAADRKAATP